MQALTEAAHRVIQASRTKTSDRSLPSSQPSNGTASTLQLDGEGKKALTVELYRRFHAMKTYGKEPESLDSILSVFLSDLSAYPIEKILRAIQQHSLRSTEFPTVADIAGLIRRNGRAPITEAQFIAVSRKDGADRTPDDWQLLKDWEREQKGWDEPDAGKSAALQAENVRLREEVASLRAENRRLADLLRKAETAITPPAEIDMPTKVQQTAQFMRESGASEADVAEFLSQAA